MVCDNKFALLYSVDLQYCIH